MTNEQAAVLLGFIQSMDGDEVGQADLGSALYGQLTTRMADWVIEGSLEDIH
jgi:hypothetical protein